MKAKNVCGYRVKVEYGFRKIRRRELLDPGMMIDIDDFDYAYLSRLGVFRNNELTLLPEYDSVEDKMTKAKHDVEAYINTK